MAVFLDGKALLYPHGFSPCISLQHTMISIPLTDEQQERLEEEFGTHEDLNEDGEAYTLPAQVYTGEDKWELRTGKVTGPQASALTSMTNEILNGNADPSDYLRATALVKKIDDIQQMLNNDE